MKLNNISTGILIVCILAGIVTAATTISDTSISVDNLILGGQTIVAYTAALNTKLSGIETLADVTDATNVNIAGAVMESDILNQSFTNLLENGDFESWSAGAAVAPDGWTGTNSPTFERSATKKFGTYSQKLTATVDDSRSYVQFDDGSYYSGRTMTFACWVYSTHAGACIGLQNDGGIVRSSYHSGGSAWERLTISQSGASVNRYVLLYPDYVAGAGIAYFDGAILVEGLVCPASSPKPFVDDGIMLQAHTPSSASDYGVTGQWCYDNDYIYVCNATDVWIRTSLTTW